MSNSQYPTEFEIRRPQPRVAKIYEYQNFMKQRSPAFRNEEVYFQVRIIE